ncbi:hypothetical protein EMCRGX_G029301 [Ephydatia muelleri]
MQSPIQPQQLKPAPPLVQTLLKDIMVKCERCKRDVKADDYDTHECSTLPTKVEVKMASRVLKRLASTSPEQTLLCTGGKITAQISVYSPKKGAEVITAVCPEFEKIVKALAGGNVKFICLQRNREMCGVQSYISSALFTTKMRKTWTQLNHINVTISYDAILNRVNKISLHHTKVMDKWLREGAFVKLVGDNVDKQCNARISPPAPLPQFSPPRLVSLKVDCFSHPVITFMKVVQSDMLVARILCDNIKDLRQLKKFVVTHIPHTYSNKIADKSEVIVLDVLHKNETKSSDMCT